jgi:hypothetical protein
LIVYLPDDSWAHHFQLRLMKVFKLRFDQAHQNFKQFTPSFSGIRVT